jgi:hypothetical protein
MICPKIIAYILFLYNCKKTVLAGEEIPIKHF